MLERFGAPWADHGVLLGASWARSENTPQSVVCVTCGGVVVWCGVVWFLRVVCAVLCCAVVWCGVVWCGLKKAPRWRPNRLKITFWGSTGPLWDTLGLSQVPPGATKGAQRWHGRGLGCH